MNESMNERIIRKALDLYAHDLIPTILDILEIAGTSDKICNMIKQAVWDKRDAIAFKSMNIKAGGKHE